MWEAGCEELLEDSSLPGRLVRLFSVAPPNDMPYETQTRIGMTGALGLARLLSWWGTNFGVSPLGLCQSRRQGGRHGYGRRHYHRRCLSGGHVKAFLLIALLAVGILFFVRRIRGWSSWWHLLEVVAYGGALGAMAGLADDGLGRTLSMQPLAGCC